MGKAQRSPCVVTQLRKAKPGLGQGQILLRIQQSCWLKKQQEPSPSQRLLTVLQTNPRVLHFKSPLFRRLTQPGCWHHPAHTATLTYPAVSLILFWSESPLRRPAPSSYIRQSPKNQQQQQPVSQVPRSQHQQQRHKLSVAVLRWAGQLKLFTGEARSISTPPMLVFLNREKRS